MLLSIDQSKGKKETIYSINNLIEMDLVTMIPFSINLIVETLTFISISVIIEF